MNTSANGKSASYGFTLVEILVVITIIGMLMAMLSAAIFRSRTRVHNARIQAELKQLESALQTYKAEYTELPPTFWAIDIVAERGGDQTLQDVGRAAVVRHLRKAFPRYVPGRVRGGNNPDGRPDIQPYEKFANDVWYAYGGTVDPLKFDAASSLVFWLGGLPEQVPGAGGQWIPAGFHSDPEFPFKPGLPRTARLYDFVPERIVVYEEHHGDPNDPSSAMVPRYLRYLPETVEAPYAYFLPHRIAGTWEYGLRDSTPRFHQYDYQHAIFGQPLGNNCVPYRDPQNPPKWRNHDTCQIISAGLDGQFGETPPDDGSVALYRVSKRGDRFTQPDYDNLSNFSKGRLQDEMEE